MVGERSESLRLVAGMAARGHYIVRMNAHWTRYEDSPLWQIHHAYYQRRGGTAWSTYEIPYRSTSNAAHARHLAQLFAAAQTSPAEAVVLELGAGSGHFAASFLAALRKDHPALAAVTRYVASDYSEKNLNDLATSPHLGPAITSGQVVLAHFDITQPAMPRPLSGVLPAAPISMVIANYVCSAVPMSPLQKRDGAWSELWLSVETDDPEALALQPGGLANVPRSTAWHRVAPDLTSVFGPLHAAVIQDASAPYHEATLFYPRRYFDCLSALRGLMPGALFVTCDYGSVHQLALRGNYERMPQHYGNSFGQSLAFALFDDFATATGLELVRTKSELDNVHIAVLGEVVPEAVRSVFDSDRDNRILGRSASDTLIDSAAAARAFAARNETLAALRSYLVCVALDPDDASLRYDLAELALSEQRGLLAREHLLVGKALAPSAYDWDFMLGRAHYLAGDVDAARAAYELSLTVDAHPQTYLNLGVLHREQGNLREALRCFTQAQSLDPEDPRGAASISDIEQRLGRRPLQS